MPGFVLSPGNNTQQIKSSPCLYLYFMILFHKAYFLLYFIEDDGFLNFLLDCELNHTCLLRIFQMSLFPLHCSIFLLYILFSPPLYLF